jgi:hypothetical protein
MNNSARPLRGNLEPRECGVCGLWSQYGHALVSGRRDVMGKTPCDNWVCDRCHGERAVLVDVGRAVDAHEEQLKNVARDRTARKRPSGLRIETASRAS